MWLQGKVWSLDTLRCYVNSYFKDIHSCDYMVSYSIQTHSKWSHCPLILCCCITANNRFTVQREGCTLFLSDLPDSTSSPLLFLSFPPFIIQFGTTVHLIFHLCSPYVAWLYVNSGEKLFNWMVISCWDGGVSHRQLGTTQRGYYKVMRLT